MGETTPGVMAAAPAAEKKVCEAFLSKAGNDLKGKGVNVNWVCKEGSPAREIIAYAADNNMDLIAMATHGRGRLPGCWAAPPSGWPATPRCRSSCLG